MASSTGMTQVSFIRVGVFLLLGFLGGCASIERLAIPEKSLLRAELAQSGTRDSLSHSDWDAFLVQHTRRDRTGIMRVDYKSVSQREHLSLKRYIGTMSAVDATEFAKNVQLAYWINLYNAATVDVILDNYPLASIRDIRDGLFDLGPWEDKRLMINGQAFSLHDIEHGVVRPLWSDTPEVHYLLNCASVGCPNLAQRAYTGDNIEEMLRQGAKAYINDAQRGVFFNSKGKLVVSKIYAWYRDDFGGSDASIIKHLDRYAAPALQAKLRDAKKISGYMYDWGLNDTLP